MATSEPIAARNLDGYDAPMIEWARVRTVLEDQYTQAPGTGGPDRHTHWLTTTNPDGSAHVRPLGALAVDGTLYFVSGAGTRKSRNVARDPRCAISVSNQSFDIVIEGTAAQVVDPTELQTVAAAYAAQGWPARVEGDAFTAPYSAPSAGPPPWNLYRVIPSTVFAFAASEPGGAARFDLVAH